MVTKEIILKHINESIEKCKKEPYQLLSLSTRVKGTLNKFARDTRKLEYEKGILVDGKGNILAEYKGDKDSVRIDCEDMIRNKLTEACKDILEEYDKEIQKYDVNDDMSSIVYDRYHELIYDRLKSLGSEVEFHIDHNHPGPFTHDEQSSFLDYNVFTCLSDGDLNNFYDRNILISVHSPNGIPFSVMNCVKSITCECSNGSRMSLVNHNPYGKNVFHNDYEKACEKLYDDWEMYLSQMKFKTGEYTRGSLKGYSKPLSEIDKSSVREEVNNRLKKDTLNMLPNIFDSDIKNFDDLNMELRVDWL